MTNLPKHIAIIMDGNGRWAEQRSQPRFKGHQAGVLAVESIIEACAQKCIPILSVFALSVENLLHRPALEVKALTSLIQSELLARVDVLHNNNIQLNFIGDLSVFSRSLQKNIQAAMTLTKNNSGLKLNLAINYSGRWDTLQATEKAIRACQSGALKVEDLNEEVLSQFHTLAGLPEPDLLIRTGGEHRISNFFLWQLAYTELYFSTTYWPDFNRIELDKAIESYQFRQRRYGSTGEQIKAEQHA